MLTFFVFPAPANRSAPRLHRKGAHVPFEHLLHGFASYQVLETQPVRCSPGLEVPLGFLVRCRGAS